MATGILSSRYKSCLSLLLFLLISLPRVRSGDAEALLALKVSADPLGVLKWGKGNGVCEWIGVKECINGRVTKLVVEGFNLSGILDEKSLNQLDQLRVLSFKQNSLRGQIPQLSGLVDLKALFLSDNMFSGGIPVSLARLHRLKVIVLSGNRISGSIPMSLVSLNRLYVLYLEENQLNGVIPPFKQSSLKSFNVSYNGLSGEIPSTVSLMRFNESSFIGNLELCGGQIRRSCGFVPSASPSYLLVPQKEVGHRMGNKKLILIIVSSVCGLVLFIAATFLVMCLRKTRKGQEARGKAVVVEGEEGMPSDVGGAYRDENGRGKQESLSWEQRADGPGSLAFLGPGDQIMSYSLEDLLKASAEILGRGTMGSTYKAVMESGYIVTVKRLKDSRYPRMEEFKRHIEIIGRLRHPNLVPLRAYLQANEERLIVYDYFPNGNLFALLHGSRGSGGSKPLHWTSCLKIAEDLASGLLYIHQNPGLTHGNLKSSNVLLGSDFESCLTDYGLTPFRNPGSVEEPSSASLFYRAPECRDVKKPVSQKSDVYSYGVLLLELLTGKTPFQDLVEQHGSDIPKWVRSVREETESGDEPSSGNEEKLSALLNVAMACVSLTPEERLGMKEVLRMIREVRAEAHVSSNSSDHSPGRWSDTVQSLTREDHESI